ncbi:MAG: hypothetical protein M0042_05350 [Nitrospiraceae bacterium]|nr:hypothetical protein [Nitrospiraceae bacterium]
MPQITRSALLTMLLCAGLLAVIGCGTANDKATFDSDKGHETGWLPAKHAEAAKADYAACAECHGEQYDGGQSKVSCTACHLGGPTSAHPEDWTGNAAQNHAPYAKENGIASCAAQYCHGTQYEGVAESGPACISCHMGGPESMHPKDWGNYTYVKHALTVTYAGSDTSKCANANCHGSDLTGVKGSGPSCTSCHLGGAFSVHPESWKANLSEHKAYVANNGSLTCSNAVCHGTQLQGVAGSGPACTTCH